MSEDVAEFFADLSRDYLKAVARNWWTPDPSIVAKLPRGGNGEPTTCRICKGYHKPGAVHLDFVGHADLTRTLIEIDPLWDWAPLAFTAEGLPLITKRGAQVVLWGRLTLLGKTLMCVGTSDDKADADKELVGDLLRNGAMRFGIFGALWSKTDGWHDDVAEGGAAPPESFAGVGPGDNDLTSSVAPSSSASGVGPNNPVLVAMATPPEKPLAAMTAGEMARYGESIGVRVSGSKADILRMLEPIVLAASGAEPPFMDLERSEDAPVPAEPETIPFSPVVADAGSVRQGVNSAMKADK